MEGIEKKNIEYGTNSNFHKGAFKLVIPSTSNLVGFCVTPFLRNKFKNFGEKVEM